MALDPTKSEADQNSKQATPAMRNLDDMRVEQLYLLEVLVNSVEVNVDPSQAKLPKGQENQPLCVRVKFIDFPCIEICQDDFFGADEDDLKPPDCKIPGPSIPGTPGNEKDKIPSAKGGTSKQAPNKSDKSGVKSTKSDKSVKSDKSDKSGKSDKSDKSGKSDKSDKSGKSDKSVKQIESKASKKSLAKAKGKKLTSNAPLTSIDLGSGKSCLFPMLPLELIRQIQRLPIALYVLRKTTQLDLIGQCKIRLGSQFEDAIIKATYDNDPLPLTTTLECESKISNVFGDETGRVNVFIRLSCFGATIVTQFRLSGQAHQDYIFKTSKRDNTMEAQKRKGYMYNKGPYKQENVVKPLVNINDISPLMPIITDETICVGGLKKMDESFSTRESVPTKIIPWKTYTKDCGCDRIPDWLSEGEEVRSMKQWNFDGMPQNSSVPCPIPDCDCNNNVENNMIPNKCPLLDCDCYSNRIPENQRRLIPFELKNQADKSKLNSGCCNRYNLQELPSDKRGSGNPNSNCPCSQNVNQRNSNPRASGFGNLDNMNNLSQKTLGQFGRISASNRQSNPITNNITGPSGFPGRRISKEPFQGCGPSEQSKNSQKNCIDSCFFADLHIPETPMPPPNSCNKSSCECGGKCKIGTNDRGEMFCYSGGCDSNRESNDRCPCNKGLNPYLLNNSSARLSMGGMGGTSTYRDVNLSSGRLNPQLQNMCSEYKRLSNLEELRNSFSLKNQKNEQPPENPPSKVTDNKSEKINKLRPSKEQLAGGEAGKKDMTQDPPKTPDSTKSIDVVKSQEKHLDSRKRSVNDLQTKFDVHKKTQDKVSKEKEKLSDKGGGDSMAVKEKETEKERRKRRQYYKSIYIYTEGMYPGINIGHKHCTKPFRMVPKTMGWLWNLGDSGDGLRVRRGWKPGAINTKLAKMLKKGKQAAEKGGAITPEKEERPPKSKASKKKHNQKPGTGKTASSQNLGDNTGPPSPTLHIHKKDGAYFIAMNPIQTGSDDDEEDRSPLLFKILPHEDEESTTSESSLEIEFTAPGAFRKKPVKPVMAEIETQYSDVETVVEEKPAKKGGKKSDKKSDKEKKSEKSDQSDKSETPSSDNKWDADQPTQVAKTKK